MLFWYISTGETRYRWRLFGTSSETVNRSANRYTDKSECEAQLDQMKKMYPEVPVIYVTIAGS
jgi:uncharacterized protein YegP (UPF0339 family)